MPRPLAHAPFGEDQQMQRDVSCVCRLLPMIIVPPLSLLFWFSFAALFGNNENKTHVSLICCGIWATPTGLRGATAHAVTRKKSFECSPGQPSLPACLPPRCSTSRLGLQPDWKLAEGSEESGERVAGGAKPTQVTRNYGNYVKQPFIFMSPRIMNNCGNNNSYNNSSSEKNS